MTVLIVFNAPVPVFYLYVGDLVQIGILRLESGQQFVHFRVDDGDDGLVLPRLLVIVGIMGDAKGFQ